MPNQLFYHFLLVFFVPGKSNPDILLHGHVRKQRIVLKKITDFPFLWLQKNPFPGIKKGNSVNHDPPFFRSFDPGNAFQGQAFPTSGSAQDSDPLFFTFKGRTVPENVKAIGIRAHDLIPVYGTISGAMLKVKEWKRVDYPFERKYFIRCESGCEDFCWFVQREISATLEEKGMPDALAFPEEKVLFLEG